MPTGVYIRTEYHREINRRAKLAGTPSRFWLGKHLPKEAREKMSLAKKGKKLSAEHIKKIIESRKGYVPSIETRKKISDAQKGRRFSGEHKKKLSEAQMGHISWYKDKKRPEISGENHPNWKGGITPRNKLIRDSNEYKLWRESVFIRDDYTCWECGQRGVELNADHIKPFSLYPELRLSIENGRTLCVDCHKKIGWNLFRENNPRKIIKIVEPQC